MDLELLPDLLGEQVSHGHPRPVDRDAVDGRVRSGKVDVLEDVGRERLGRGALPSRDTASGGDDGLSRSDVLPVGKAERVGADRLGGEEVVLASLGAVSLSESDGSDTVGVPEGNESETGDHGRAGVGSRDLRHEVPDGGEDVLLVDSELAGLLEVVGKDVEQELRVRVGVDVPVSVRVEERS